MSDTKSDNERIAQNEKDIIAIKADVKSHGKRLKNLEDNNKVLLEMSSSIKAIDANIGYIREDQKAIKDEQGKQGERINALEDLPGKKALENKAKNRQTIIGAVVSFIVGVGISLLVAFLTKFI